MYDNKITIIPQAPYFTFVLTEFKISHTNKYHMELCRIIEDMLGLAEKALYNIDQGYTDEDVLQIVNSTSLIEVPGMTKEIIYNMVSSSIHNLLSNIIIYNIHGTVKYVIDVDDYKISIETMRL